MLDKIGQTQNMRQVAGTIPIRHRCTVGVAGECISRALPDEARLLATRCVERSSLRIGMAVEPVWASERTGALTGIAHFRPVAE